MSETVFLDDSPSSSPNASPSPLDANQIAMPPMSVDVMVNTTKSSTSSDDRHQSRRRVTFHERRTEWSIESISSMSEADRNLLWYSEEDVETCRGEVREMIEKLKEGRGLIQEADIRGLELRLSPNRQRRKYMIVHAILRAQRRYADPNKLSNIARKCTVWSKTVAAIVAQRDYCSLYHPERVSSIASLPSLEKYPLPFKQPKEELLEVSELAVKTKKPCAP